MSAASAADFASASAQSFADGTVLAALNSSPTGYKNWVQSEKYPTISDEPVVTSIELSGTYKTEYYVGDALDLTGLEIAARWSNGDTNPLSLNEVEISGYDNTTRGVQSVTLTYGAASATFNVTVLKRPDTGNQNGTGNTITVKFTLLGDTLHDSDTDGKVHTLENGNLTTWIAQKSIAVDLNATVKDVLEQALTAAGYSWSNPSGNYIESITRNGVTLEEFTNGPNSGWMYRINGVHSLLGVNEQFLENGDEIVFHYTDDYTLESESAIWNEQGTGNSGG
ncbi:MAG: bacterial Ig-like domain-containing protein, partial [Oscillospiraceae bacterium]|nr:bacterial Ig-like domain-containing protein [Oscillospiraceae bacterium]